MLAPFRFFTLCFSYSTNSLHVCIFKIQSRFYRTHISKLTFYDSQILHCLSKHKYREARNLLEKLSDRDHNNRVVCWTSLLSKYSKYGFTDEARELFEIMPERNIVTYNAMLSCYVQSGRLNEAWQFFMAMPERNVVSWTSMLCGLADAGRIDDARRLFDEMPERNVMSWNSMLVGLIRNVDIEEAREVFDVMPVKNLVSWNAMMAGYAENGRMEEARSLFDNMQARNVITWTTLVAGYCRVGDVDEAYCLFKRMPDRNLVSWTAMIGGFTWNGFYEDALSLFIEMRKHSDIKPNGETFISLAYACAGLCVPCLGKQLHGQLIINNWDYNDYDGRLSKSLIYMYSMFGTMDFARYIFIKNLNSYFVQSCNAMINGYIRIGELEKAQCLFDNIPVRDKISWTSMITGYFNVGQVSNACYLFNNMTDRDAVAWTTMISGHVQNEGFDEAIYLFTKMRALGVSPLNSTYSILLGAAGAMAHLDHGRQLHCLMFKSQLEHDLIIDNSLISMYAKCGEIDNAFRIFSNMTCRDLVSWNSMIMGYSHHGIANEALKVFESMLGSGTCPNDVTFLGILSACSHAGLVRQGRELFSAMNDAYAIKPSLEHDICMINLFGRAGKLKEAEEFVSRLPFKPNHAVWGALLGVCGLGETNVGIARRAASRLLELDPLNAPGHVTLCNIYAANGQHVEQKNLRMEMGMKGVRKIPGCSWLLLRGRCHAFLSGDRVRQEVDEILSLLFENDLKLNCFSGKEKGKDKEHQVN